MSERDYAPLSIACVRGLCDKIYEKRKFAGVEIEKMVKDFSEAGNTSQIRRLIRVLGQELMSSTNPNVKNGALMGLSSVAVGLGKGCSEYVGELVRPALACAGEGEPRVRYQAAEALFNVCKVARGAALAHLPPLFDALARLAADPEPQVRQAAELLDRLVKDIVTESAEFEVAAFVPLLREHMYTRAAAARAHAAGWLSALDALPHAPLAPHLPDLLDPLLAMLTEPTPEIRRMVAVQLSEFLRGIRKAPARADLQAMINILIAHAHSSDELVQLTAVTWLKEFVELGGARMLPAASGILAAALPCLAYADDQRKSIREAAATVNLQLTSLVSDTATAGREPDGEGGEGDGEGGEGDGEGGEGGGEGGEARLNLPAVVGVLTQMLRHNSVHTKVAALDWILHLYNKLPNEMARESGAVFAACVAALPEPHDDVVRRALAVLAEICSGAPGGDLESNPYYLKFLKALLRLLANDENLLEDRGPFIIRQLCVLLEAEQVYAALARLLASEPDLRFAAALVSVLSAMLLTAAELHPLRHRLRTRPEQETRALFRTLYGSWCHSPVALLALCLLAHHYRHCAALIATFGDLEITVEFLTEVDKLVQLIESPIFAYLRLELLGARGAALRGALYGLLMLLPQSQAFHTLRARLQCAPSPPPHPLERGAAEEAGEEGEGAQWAELLAQFERVQAAHRARRLELDRERARRDSRYCP